MAKGIEIVPGLRLPNREVAEFKGVLGQEVTPGDRQKMPVRRPSDRRTPSMFGLTRRK